MNYVKGICAGCDTERLIVNKSKKLCLGCNKKASIQRSRIRREKRIAEGEDIDPLKLALFYQSYWNRHPIRYCVECGVELKNFKRWHIHHLIPKRDFKEYEDDIVFADSNCVYVCLQCHSQAESDVSKTQNIQERYKIACNTFKQKPK